MSNQGGIGRGTAIFAKTMEGINKGIETGMKYQHMQHIEKMAEQTRDYARFRRITEAVNDWHARGGHLGPIQDDGPAPTGVPAGWTAEGKYMPVTGSEAQRGSKDPLFNATDTGQTVISPMLLGED